MHDTIALIQDISLQSLLRKTPLTASHNSILYYTARRTLDPYLQARLRRFANRRTLETGKPQEIADNGRFTCRKISMYYRWCDG